MEDTKQQPVDKDGFAILRSTERTKFSVIDAHNERVRIKDEHPEHPRLTALALSILYPKKGNSVGR